MRESGQDSDGPQVRGRCGKGRGSRRGKMDDGVHPRQQAAKKRDVLHAARVDGYAIGHVRAVTTHDCVYFIAAFAQAYGQGATDEAGAA